MKNCHSWADCPLAEVHKRLEDVYVRWQEAGGNYSDPDGFRRSINGCIQELRNVTWLLQKHKAEISGFDAWYGKWQGLMKADAVMKWLQGARNHIVKKGDLRSRSTVRASVFVDWKELPVAEYTLTPQRTLPQIISCVLAETLPEAVKERGLLAVERRWVVDDLPDHDLLNALGHALDFLRRLIDSAHVQAGWAVSNGDVQVAPGYRWPEVSIRRAQTIWINLSTGKRIRLAKKEWTLQRVSREEMKAKYGMTDAIERKIAMKKTFDDELELLFEGAKMSLTIQGEYCTMVTLHSPRHPPKSWLLAPRSRAEKYHLFGQIAAEVERLEADKVVLITEAWIAPFDKERPELLPGDSPKRKEVLMLSALTSDDNETCLTAEILRQPGTIRFGATKREKGGCSPMFNPIREVWRKSRKDQL